MLAVGFEPVRQNVSAAAGAPALSVVLQPVAVLGGPAMKDFSGFRSATTRGAGDVLANLPDSLHGAAREARMLSAAAARLKSAAAWEAAADSWWRLILARPVGAAEAEADFQLAAARVHAWEIAPTPARRDAARRATEYCLASARPGPQLDQARIWQERLLR